MQSVAGRRRLASGALLNLPHFAQKRAQGEALDEDGEDNDSEADGDDLFAKSQVGGEAKRQGKSQSPAQTSPEKYVLLAGSDAKR